MPAFVRAVVLFLLGLASPALAGDVNRTGLSGIAIEGYDPVAYWIDGAPRQGSDDFTFEWQGATWRFASAQHLALFAAEPERYAPAFGGYCAEAMTKGLRADIHPFFFAIEDGALYLFLTAESRADWLVNTGAARQAADYAWASLGPDYF